MASLRGRCGRVSCCTRVLLRHPYAGKPKWRSLLTLSGSTLLSAKFSWSNSLRSWFHGSRDKICATFNMPRSTPKTLNNGEQSLDFTYYALKAGQLTYDCRYSTMHGMPVTGGRGFKGLKPLWYNGVPPLIGTPCLP